MMAAILQLLLIAGLVLCPFRCQVEGLACAGPAGEAREESGCCRCGHSAESRSADPSPPVAPHDEAPAESPCQCICSGAVLDKPGGDLLLESPRFVDFPEDPAAAPPALSRPQAAWHAPPPVLAGLSTGRAICTRDCSLLC